MDVQEKFQLRRSNPGFIAISVGILAICLFYTLIYAFGIPPTGFGTNNDWIVIYKHECTSDPVLCAENNGKIKKGDHLVSIGDVTFDDARRDRRVVPYTGYEPGDSISIALIRDGELQNITWRIPKIATISRLELILVPLLLYSPFWLVGTFVLLFMQPHDMRWRLLILYSYLTAIWLAIGLTSLTHLAYSSLFLHALSWLLIPVFIHLHLVIPAPLYKRRTPLILIFLYVVTAIIAAMEMLQLLPESAYVLGLLVAGLGSITLLTYRSFFKQESSARLASRLMLTGVVLALGPSIVFWIIPTLIGGSPGSSAITLSLVAIPILPMFYGYAIYKHQLGIQEPRINRLLSNYALFLIYVTVLGLAFLLIRHWIGLASEFLAFGLIVLLALILSVLPLKDMATRSINLLSYGTSYRKEEVVHYFAGRIPTITNKDELKILLTDELLPTLQVNQCALIWLDQDEPRTVYHWGIDLMAKPLSVNHIRQLSRIANTYLPPQNDISDENSEEIQWIRLVIPLNARSTTTGYWLFGKRDPDSYYSKDDIDLLNILARQLAITLENARLFVAFRRELTERKKAEGDLARYIERLRLQHELDKAILAADSPREIGQAALEGLRELVPKIRSRIILLDYETKAVEILVDDGIETKESSSERNVTLEAYLKFPGFIQGGFWEFDQTEQSAVDSQLRSLMVADDANSLMCAPLKAAGKLIGLLIVISDNSRAFSSEHFEIAKEVASSVALAMHNARLRKIITQHSHDLRRLSARLIHAQETERKWISYELHDEIGQVLTAITFNLSAIESELVDTSNPKVNGKLVDTRLLVERLTNQVRSLSLELRPAMLQDLGIVPTLRWYIKVYSERRDIPVEMDVSNLADRLPEDIEIALYRVVQEALTNVARHANAHQIRLCLEYRDSIIQASIEDDGKGFDSDRVLSTNSSLEGLGLVTIRERVSALNGSFNIDTAPGKGTRLNIKIPMDGR